MRSLAWRSILVAGLTSPCGACSGTPTATIDIVTGEESDAFSRAPAPTTLVVEIADLRAAAREVARVSLPADAISLGDVKRTDIGAVRVRALGPSGEVLLRGETLYVQFGALDPGTLSVFVQRTGELARLPRGPSVPEAPTVALALDRYVVTTKDGTTTLYDLLTLQTLDRAPVFPRAVRSLATHAATLVAIDEAGASAFDLETGATSELSPPAGGSFAEIAGGSTVTTPDGSEYVVGATRSAGGPSARVLRISREGDVTFASLASPREGACATWVPGRGLVVWGGTDAGSGGEVLPPGAAASSPLAFPADPVRGCGVAALDGGHVVVGGGGAAPARVVDLACGADCQPLPWPDALPLGPAQAQALSADAALFVGDDESGTTRAFRASASGVREVALKNPRRGARLVGVRSGTAALVGGAAGIEQYLE